ncbi:hypothetical protein QTP88_007652 [Uroleucon formosanum]
MSAFELIDIINSLLNNLKNRKNEYFINTEMEIIIDSIEEEVYITEETFFGVFREIPRLKRCLFTVRIIYELCLFGEFQRLAGNGRGYPRYFRHLTLPSRLFIPHYSSSPVTDRTVSVRFFSGSANSDVHKCVINTKVAIMSKESISYTFNTGVTTSNRQINKKYKNKQKKNLKNQLSGVKKNKLVEDILKDWENDDCFYSENSDLNISGILPITNEVVTKNKLLDVEKDKLIEELLKDWD